MADEQELKELKEELRKLELRIARIKRQRPGWMNFLIAFLIIIMMMLFGIGVIKYFLAA